MMHEEFKDLNDSSAVIVYDKEKYLLIRLDKFIHKKEHLLLKGEFYDYNNKIKINKLIILFTDEHQRFYWVNCICAYLQRSDYLHEVNRESKEE